jgi:hypothetical protein
MIQSAAPGTRTAERKIAGVPDVAAEELGRYRQIGPRFAETQFS